MARPNVKLYPGSCFAPAACLDVFLVLATGWTQWSFRADNGTRCCHKIMVPLKKLIATWPLASTTRIDKLFSDALEKKHVALSRKKLHRRRKRHPPKMAWSCLATNARPSMKMNMSWHRYILSDWIGLTICECKLSYVVKLVHLPRLTIFYRQNRLPFKFHSFSPLPFCFRTPNRSNVNLLSGAAVCAVAAGRSRQKVQRKAKESRTRQAPGRKVGPKLGCCFFLGKPGKPKRLQGTRVKGTK